VAKTITPTPSAPTPDKNFNLSDSIGIGAVVIAILLWVFVPNLYTKILGLVLAAGGTALLAYRSHWTRYLRVGQKHVIAVGLAVLILAVGSYSLGSEHIAVLAPLPDIAEKSDPPPPLHVSALPGMSLHMQIRLNHLAGDRRKYLFDFGNKNNERLSIYISPDSIFTLAFLDAKGEQHPVQIPLGGDGIPLGEFFYLGCEFGIDGQSTQLWVLVDGKERGSIRLPFRVDIESLDVPGGVVGADLDGNNGGSFDLKEFLAYSKTLNEKDIQNLAQYFQGHSNIPHVEFRGKQWMRVKSVGSHDLKQIDPSAAPIFRKE
jgi:hypothetical protein